MRLRMPKLEVEGAADRQKSLSNDDLLPIPAERRTWDFWTFTTFWFSAVGTVANWTSGGTYLAMGMTVWDGLLVNFFGFLLISFFMVLNGRVGAVYHVGFPVYCRSSFGVYGALWPAFNRAMSAVVWNGVNVVQGGQAVYIMLHAIFPSVARLPNHMPKSSALDTANMIGMILFWLALAAILCISIPKWRILIYIKLVAYVISSCAMLAMALVHSGGVSKELREKPTTHGSERVWLIVRFTLLSAAGCSTFASNASDWQRNARKPNDPIFGQIFGFPMSNFIVSLFGCIVARSSEKTYGEVIWNPLTYLDMMLSDTYNAKYRAGAFFIALGFCYSSLFSCAFENVLPAGNDIAAILPRYLSMKRAMAICMILTLAINPWFLLGSASIFISFLASYQIFLFAITGVLLTDYFIVLKGRFDLAWMYTADPQGPYWYTLGLNWRAFVAYLVGLGINFAGFLHNMGAIDVSIGVQRSFYFAFITSGVASGLVYYLLARFFPQPSYKEYKGLKFKEWTQEEVEVYAAGNDDKPSRAPSHGGSDDVEDKAVDKAYVREV
ncbi:hypothetical protein Q8F55_002610 [Vanrija albida]|uniref:Uridine permease n=1 Tax=Vanrija albida TaxID=181172 RepID=A0ABR3QB90_9TREE